VDCYAVDELSYVRVEQRHRELGFGCCGFRVARGHDGRDRPLELCAGSSLLLARGLDLAGAMRLGRLQIWLLGCCAGSCSCSRSGSIPAGLLSICGNRLTSYVRGRYAACMTAIHPLPLTAIATVIGNRADRKKL